MNLKSFFKQKTQKSFGGLMPNTNSATIYVDNKGNILDTFYGNSTTDIYKNGAVNTISSKHYSIINEADFDIKEVSAGKDAKTSNKDALEFLDWLNYPNSIPSPSNKNDLFKYWINGCYKTGITGAIFAFEKGQFSLKKRKNITLAQTITYEKLGGVPRYRVQINEYQQYLFNYRPEYLNFVYETDNELLFLYVCGEFDISKACYRSRFEDIIQYIRLQNHLIDFSVSFHKQACFPSQVVQLNYKNLPSDRQLNNAQIKEFEDAVDAVKNQMMQSKSSANAGHLIIPKHPHLEVSIHPLAIPTSATDNITYQTMVSDKIYSYIDGGSSAGFEGKSEYSNNASAKLQELYDGAFRIAKAMIIDSLNNFMRTLLILSMSKTDTKKIYLYLNLSSVQIYQKQAINQIINLSQSSLLTINEGRERISDIAELYNGLDDLKQGDVLYAELGKKPNENKATSTQ